jgi:alkylation response protein AidB-like acyl-CoA dehydrogenase
MSGLDAGRLNVAAGAVGAHRACLEASVAFARERRQFGQRIGDFQLVGATLAEMDVSLQASRLLVHHAARLRDRGLDARAAVSAAKLRATETALDAARSAIQIHGSRGYTDELPLERHLRDLIALTIYEGTSNIQRVILARHLLGRDEGAKG